MLATQRFTQALSRTRTAVARRLFLDRQAEFWTRELDPVRSLREVRARVVGVVQETRDTRTFVLEPNAAWRGHRAGQYTSVELEIDGVRVRRCYSIASAPGQALISITVKRTPGGRVSPWMHRHLGVGDVVGLGPATGDFVLPSPAPGRLLLVSGGSGITPVMSILRHLASVFRVHDVVFVHHARSRDDVIFGAELDTLAARHPGLRLAVCLDDDPGATRGFDEARFTALVPDWTERESFLCGPAPMMERAERLWSDADLEHRLVRERFTPALRPVALANPGQPVEIDLARSRRALATHGSGSLLEELERAGERPAHGCRMGICHSCTCRKRRGTVQNLVTGEVSSEPDEDIRLCISAPLSDLELDL